MNPRAAVVSRRAPYAVAERVEMRTIAGASSIAARRSAISKPSMSGSWTSSNTIRGRRCWTAAIASAPSAASPTTAKPSDSSKARASDRNAGGSSTISTVGRIDQVSHAPRGGASVAPPRTSLRRMVRPRMRERSIGTSMAERTPTIERSTAMRAFLILSSVCAAGALTVVSPGLAGQPVTQTLNPPPPAYETCKAVGNGTICQGTQTFAFGPIDTATEGPALVCGSGAGAFDVFDSEVGNSLARRTYDANGNLVRRVRYDQVTAGQNINPLTGAYVPYTSTLTNVDVLAVPGDLGST